MEDRQRPLEDLTVASSSARPDAHTQRYDRQLRLWGTSGQSGLEAASILVINGSATATQILKNLVLPGIGSFTILDPQSVTAADVANNFFLEESSLGKSRAKEATKFLLELNESVKGHAVTEDLSAFLARTPSALAPFSLVISVDVLPAQMAELAVRCWHESIPLVVARSCGLVVSFAVQCAEVAHIETHPPSTVDLRLDHAFPSLLDYARSLDFAAMDSHEYGHIPSVVIVVRAVEDWKSAHDGNAPATFAERKQLSALITSQKRQQDDENFDEAAGLVKTLARPTGIPPDIQALFDDPACTSANSPDSSPFWLLLHAVRNFALAQVPPVLPLPGSLPDMKATSSGFHALSTVYRVKAREDLASVRSELTKLGVPPDHVAHKELDTFVKHAAHLHLARGVRYDEMGFSKQTKIDLVDGDDGELSGIFVALLASEAFAKKQGRWPGTLPAGKDPEATADMPALQEAALAVLAKMGKKAQDVPAPVLKGLQEITRSGGADLPQMAALNGGMIAQEVIKLVTRQYVPIDGFLVFEGCKSRSMVF